MPMCQDCETTRDRVGIVVRELVADLLLPVILFAIVIGALLVTGTVRFW